MLKVETPNSLSVREILCMWTDVGYISFWFGNDMVDQLIVRKIVFVVTTHLKWH